jgi:hypothetical protein
VKLEDLMTYLEAEGFGVQQVLGGPTGTIWGGQFPPDGTGLMIEDTGGTVSSWKRKDSLRTFFVVCRSRDFTKARDQAEQIYELLDQCGKQIIGSAIVFDCQAIQQPFQLGGQNARQTWDFVCNYQFTVRRRSPSIPSTFDFGRFNSARFDQTTVIHQS